jgi:hypothetical protein
LDSGGAIAAYAFDARGENFAIRRLSKVVRHEGEFYFCDFLFCCQVVAVEVTRGPAAEVEGASVFGYQDAVRIAVFRPYCLTTLEMTITCFLHGDQDSLAVPI